LNIYGAEPKKKLPDSSFSRCYDSAQGKKIAKFIQHYFSIVSKAIFIVDYIF
jgi:hypothetical protein